VRHIATPSYAKDKAKWNEKRKYREQEFKQDIRDKVKCHKIYYFSTIENKGTKISTSLF
jgi:hypothetical protein